MILPLGSTSLEIPELLVIDSMHYFYAFTQVGADKHQIRDGHSTKKPESTHGV